MSTKSKLQSVTDSLRALTGNSSSLLPAAPSVGSRPDNALAVPAALPATPGPQFPPVVPRSVPRTGPGQMLQFRGQMLATESEISRLKEQLSAYDGAAVTRRLDTAQIVPSRWANRHADAFANPAFQSLKRDIQQAGGNVQPILVRPLVDQPDRYELVFGHRRHRACAELGLPVLATVETQALSDVDLFAMMDRENRERADLSPYEQGTMYRRALDQGLYPSNRRLADALGVSHTWVANVLLVADLPAAVIDCFASPTAITHRHAKTLTTALDADPKGVLRRAERLRLQERSLGAAAVVAELVGETADEVRSAGQLLRGDGRPAGRWSQDRDGRMYIQIDAGALGGAMTPEALAAAVARLLDPV